MSEKVVRRLSRWMALCCICLLTVACNDEDDSDIFVGNTWKVGNLYGPTGPVLDQDEAETIAKEESFYIKFESMEGFTGRTLDKNFSGSWSVDLKERTISFRFKDTGNPADALSKRVIRALENTVSYEGDYNYLKLMEREGAYMLLRPY